MDNVTDVLSGLPTTAHIANLCTHIKTSGLHNSKIAISPFSFEVLDVGGTRSERKKWVHCLGERPDFMIYVVDLNGYCQNLAEDLDAVSDLLPKEINS